MTTDWSAAAVPFSVRIQIFRSLTKESYHKHGPERDA
jgi:hypothetical protein